MSAALGWAFLVGRTHAEGNRLILGPDVPAQRRLIVANARPDPNGRTAMAQVIRDGSYQFGLVSGTYRLTEAQTQPSSTTPDALVLDEHGRPIDLVYGFVCDADVVAVAETDLAAARTQALSAYRGAWAGVTIAPSQPFPLASGVRGFAKSSRSIAREGPPQPPKERPLRLGMLAGALVILIGLIGGAAALLAMRSEAVRVPDGIVGAWTGDYRPAGSESTSASVIGLTIPCGLPCEVDSGDQIGTVHVSIGCDYTLFADSVDGPILAAHATSRASGTACPPDGLVRITPGAGQITMEWGPHDTAVVISLHKG